MLKYLALSGLMNINIIVVKFTQIKLSRTKLKPRRGGICKHRAKPYDNELRNVQALKGRHKFRFHTYCSSYSIILFHKCILFFSY